MSKHTSGAAADALLDRDARRAGVLREYTDALGTSRRASASVVTALCRAVAQEPGRVSPAAVIVGVGARSIQLPTDETLRARPAGELRLEDGGTLSALAVSRAAKAGVRLAADGPIPLGVHELVLDGAAPDSPRRFVMASPKSLAASATNGGRGAERRLAVFLPLYSVTPGGAFGIGTYSDLRELCEWAHATAGALVGTLPLFPAFLDKPFDPSPYAPVSRLMWNELFVDPTQAPEWRAVSVRKSAESGAFARQVRAARKGDLVDYRLSWKLARRTLGVMAAAAKASPRRWAEVVAASSGESMRYAKFRAAADAAGAGWSSWKHPRGTDLIDAAPADPRDVDLYLYAQTLASSQLAALKRTTPTGSPLYLDLPVGVHGDGYDACTRPDLFLHDFSAGAPPDPLNTHGQAWGFPPMHPTAGRADGYAHLRAVLRRMLSVAGVLRIDHVMGLYRMYCVLNGESGADGAYLRFPEEELFALVMIEAARAGAMVVGEDLGTVPEPVRRIMKRRGILGMHVQQFALGGPPGKSLHPAGAQVLASLNTHDTPTFNGFWAADDADLRLSLGHLDEDEAAGERTQRTATRREVARDLRALGLPAGNGRAAAFSLSRVQCRGPAPIALVNLEDLWGERRPQNVPGTSTEHPNWRRRAAKPLSAIVKDRKLANELVLLRKERRRPVKESR